MQQQPQANAAKSWWQADTSQIYLRMVQLEGELSVACALLDLRETRNEASGEPRSPVVTELLGKWHALIDQKGPAS